MSGPNPYVGAYPWLAARRGVWREIVRWIARDTPGTQTVIELGAGYCDFINQYPAPHRIAFDLNPEMRQFAAPDVDLRIADASTLPGIADESIDLVFASNFLEHFDAAGVDTVLASVARVLRPGGRLALLQPNHRRCREHYFDDPTHQTAFDDVNIAPWLERHRLRVVELDSGLLPFSMNSRAPKWPMLVRLYLHSPVRPFAAQMYVVAQRS